MGGFDREKLLIGNGVEKLKRSSVALFGVGGVGGFIAEGLIRSGLGAITLFDGDVVEESNINRQIIATENSVGKDKTEVMKERILSIDGTVKVNCEKVFYLPENADNYDLSKFDYVIDAVDTVSAKIEIIKRAKALGVPVISCMGTGFKTDISALKVADIEQTKNCPLARVVRQKLKKLNITGVKVVYSDELPKNIETDGKTIPSMIFVPAVAGLTIAKEVVFDLINKKD